MSLASLEASQDEPRVWVWQRPQAGSERPFPKVPEEFHGRNQSDHVLALGISLPHNDLSGQRSNLNPMRTSDVDIVMPVGPIPARSLANAVAADPQDRPPDRASRLGEAGPRKPGLAVSSKRFTRAQRPVVLAARTRVHERSSPRLRAAPAGKVVGPFLVAAPISMGPTLGPERYSRFLPTLLDPLRFPSFLIASATEPHGAMPRSRQYPAVWRSDGLMPFQIVAE
jgi:hypothetical protein